jgi:cathepsin L
MYEIFPAQDKYMCWVGGVHGGTGPTRRRRTSRKLAMAGGATTQQQQLHPQNFVNSNDDDPDDPPPQEYLGFVLPDLSEDRWKYVGTEKYNSKNLQQSPSISPSSSSSRVQADVWEWDLTEGEMEMKYVFYTDASTGHPLELNMIGINLYTGGHKDNYIASYYNYEDVSKDGDAFPEGTFDPPVDVECTDAEPDAAAAVTAGSGASTTSRYSTIFLTFMRHALPSVHYGKDSQYDIFMHQHARRHATKKEYHTRHGHYQASKTFVENWNSGRDTTSASASNSIGDKYEGTVAQGSRSQGHKRHRVALNRFADWSREEYRSLLGLKRKKENEIKGVSGERFIATVDNFTSTPHFLPAQVIWKGTPADSPVKDQAACGSCWAFSSAAALEAAVYRTTGTQTLLSEQEMMDCGWEAPGLNTGCMGGEQDTALEWALQRGGVAALADYPYKGVNDFCRSSTGSTTKDNNNSNAPINRVPIKGKLVFVQGGEQALQAALLSQGPMAVSIDAEADDFRFYAGGVYYNPDCATEAADLNHAVIASGYGIDQESGTPVWLVKNIWSTYWGEEGYIRIAREPNDCGIATEPIYIATEE